MRADHGRHASLLLQRADDVADLLGVLRIEAGRRLVEQDHFGIAQEGLRDAHALLHAVRQRVDAAIAVFGQADLRERLVDFALGSLLVHAVEQTEEHELLEDRHVALERGVLRQDRHAPLQVRDVRDVAAEHGDRAFVRAQEPGDEREQRGLAGAVGPEQAEDRSARHVKRNAVERARRTKALAQIVHRERRSSCSGRHGVSWLKGREK